MLNLSNFAIVGAGPTTIYLLNNIWKNLEVFKSKIDRISIFEKECSMGIGMPYSPNTTDIYNLANISSAEIPDLSQSFGDWLRRQELSTLKSFNITELPIDDSEVYSRVALGEYFRTQYQLLVNHLKSEGIKVMEYPNKEVVDMIKTDEGRITVLDFDGGSHNFSMVVIANGHVWKDRDKPSCGYYASPWPIHKLLPREGQPYKCQIGTLGASLSAFDVVTSIAHRYGKFIPQAGGLRFVRGENASNFKITMHSAEGWLPHLQYEQVEPVRQIYRHFQRDRILSLMDPNGFLRIESYFDELCRPALKIAFLKDEDMEAAEKLDDPAFTFKDFVLLMSERHEYIDSFEGMRYEMLAATESVERKKPIHWMETLDDLMYTLNYHAEFLPAEDHLFFKKEIMAFLMNVIAALPLQSAKILLALYDEGCIDIKAGKVTVEECSSESTKTTIRVEGEAGSSEHLQYDMFVNCAGQPDFVMEDFLFPTLVRNGTVRSASAKFINKTASKVFEGSIGEDILIRKETGDMLKIGGIDIDSSYRTIGRDGHPNDSLFDINFTHTSGIRPYSYGLQACNATSLILVESWLARIKEKKEVGSDITTITDIYENSDEL